MTWGYRAVEYHDGTYGVHEVYFNRAGEAYAMTAEPRAFVGESPCEILGALLEAAAAVAGKPVFVEPETWAAMDAQP